MDSVIAKQIQEDVCKLRIKLNASVILNFFKDLFRRKCIPVDSLGIHGIVTVGNSHDAGGKRDILSGKSVRITRSIIMFMM